MDASVLERKAQHAQKQIDAGRKELISAIREAEKAGMSQREIASAVGRSQPEVSRLLRFQGKTSLARKVSANRAEILKIIREAGLSNPRIFGSVATGKDHQNSDIDLLVTTQSSIGIFKLATVAHQIEKLLDAPVDLVLEPNIRPDLRERILAEAVKL